MYSQEIRRRFLAYFKEQKHLILPSSPVVPHDDPTLLFTNAGMNQFKDVFLGKSQRDYKRAATSQKCIRVGGKHNDLDNVGHTKRHMTFFEMLGNFSFGDYFKRDAIRFAWELSTQVFEFPPEKLWISVFEKDDEALDLWSEHINPERIVRIGEKDNFWAMGDVGPCGPCTELFFDRGPSYGQGTSPANDPTGERFLEFWNLVFMQFNRQKGGELIPLPAQSVDTGSGLERVVMLKMGVDSVFQTDILQEITREIEKQHHKRYSTENAASFHVISDHIRSLSFAIADGAQPGNIDRGYVLRKIVRRAVRYGRLLGINTPFLSSLVSPLISLMGEDYPELKTAKSRIEELLHIEEESFLKTLKRGGNILSSIMEKALTSTAKEISGEDAFKLKDTYGFPLEEIMLMAKDASLSVNLDAFELLEQKAKELSRQSAKTHAQLAEKNLFENFKEHKGTCEFVGYSQTEATGSIIALIKDGEFVEELLAGDEGWIALDKTPFYAEKGGQIGDTGTLQHQHALFYVEDCQSPSPQIILHKGRVEKGALILGEPLSAQVDPQRRRLIENYHTSAHLLHYALEKVLGPHIRQAGSLVAPDRLRFDFSHQKPLTRDEIRQIEQIVNELIRKNTSLTTYELPYSEAQKQTDIKQFFGDKYGETVRVVDVAPSKELCGGTHVDHTGRIGFFRIAKEMSIAKGVRRIEALTGAEAERFAYEQEEKIDRVCATLHTTPEKLEEAALALIQELTDLKALQKKARAELLQQTCQTLLKNIEQVGSIPCITSLVSLPSDQLAPLANELTAQFPQGVILLALHSGETAHIAIRVGDEWVKKGAHAGEWVKELAPLIKGSGGGKPGSAQAGGTDPQGLSELLKQFKNRVRAL